jgi:hypothetical protein
MERGEGEWPHSCHNETHPSSFPFELPSLPPNTETSQQHNRIDRAIEQEISYVEKSQEGPELGFCGEGAIWVSQGSAKD